MKRIDVKHGGRNKTLATKPPAPHTDSRLTKAHIEDSNGFVVWMNVLIYVLEIIYDVFLHFLR